MVSKPVSTNSIDQGSVEFLKKSLMISPLYPQQIINSLNPKCEKIFIMCHKIGFPPISIMGFGFN